MNDFDQLSATPGLRGLLDLVWRVFGVNTAIASLDGRRAVIFDKEERAQPFCGALQKFPDGAKLCGLCDQSKFLEARSEMRTFSYRCHAGLREFIVPVIRQGRVIAILQTGQVHDRPPTAPTWQEARRSLSAAGLPLATFRTLFQRNRILSSTRQDDLLALLELISARLAQADERKLRTDSGQTQAVLGRVVTYIEANLGENLSVTSIARVANLTPRTLMRLFRKETETSILNYILRRRNVRALQLLRQTDRSCADIAMECGFGSVQHFNRMFRRYQKTTPTEWRRARPGDVPAVVRRAGADSN